MNLTNFRNFPPGGYTFRQPELNWKTTPELALMGLDAVARAVQILRIQNPLSGLNPEYEACLLDIGAYTCARLDNDPRFCGPQSPEEASAQSSATPRTSKRKCASCGKR